MPEFGWFDYLCRHYIGCDWTISYGAKVKNLSKKIPRGKESKLEAAVYSSFINTQFLIFFRNFQRCGDTCGWTFLAPMENRRLIICTKFSVLFLIALLGWMNLDQVLHGDQAMFTVYASEMSRGALLYRDIWDIKQPGIFIFYLVGGKLFGFNERGIHLFELIYWLVFSIVLQSTLKDYFRSAVLSQITPLMTVGVYYAVCRSWHMTQVEALVGFPMYLTLWAAFRALSAPTKQKQFWLSFLSGLFGGVVLIFKAAFLPIVLVFWLLLFSFLARQSNRSLTEIFASFCLPIALGVSILLLGVFTYFAWYDALPIVFYTFFQYPSRAVMEVSIGNRLEVLRQGIYWFVLNFKSLLLVTTIGVFLSLKRNFYARPSISKIDFMSAGLIAWLLMGAGVILCQRLSWWEYHYLLLFVSLGILGAKSLEIIWERAPNYSEFFAKTRGKIALIGIITVIFLPHLKQYIRKATGDFDDRARTLTADPSASSDDFIEKYRRIASEVAFLAETKGAGEKIFVVGQPLYYYLSGRAPAISSNGWMQEFFLNKEWQQLEAQLIETKPKYIFVEVNLHTDLSEKSSRITELLKNHYRLRAQNKNSDCYELYSQP